MFGIEIFDPKTVWVNLTNIALGVVTLVCFGIVAYGVALEVFERMKKRAVAAVDDHAFAIPELGMTMADGGRKLDGEPTAEKK